MVGKIGCFKIRLTKLKEVSKDSILDTFKQSSILDIIYEQNFFAINPIVIVADPFLFVHDEKLYLFYEEKRLFSPGVLKMIKTEDLNKWSNPVTVLKEPFHLSYPFVFENKGEVYMIPETSEAKEVRLYKASNSELTQFEINEVLLRHDDKDESFMIDYSDSSVLHKNGQFYLMTTLKKNGINELYLYLSDNLNGPYKKHPASPVCKSQKYGRNAGHLLEWDGEIYRIAQDCTNRYGENISLLKVKQISPTDYSELLVKDNIIDTNIPFYKDGGHQFNFVCFKDQIIVATDAKEYRFYIAHIIDKLLKLL